MTLPLSAQRRLRPLLSKQGATVADLAQMLLLARVGDRIEPIQEQAARLDASVGTVQTALEYLQSIGAAEIVSRGRLGSFVQRLRYAQLWQLATHRALSGALPLPYARRIEGIATALRQQLGAQVDLNLRFLRGSARRMQALAAQECDWALISRFAAEMAAAHGFAIDTVALLGPHSYMAAQVLLLRDDTSAWSKGGLHDGMRVGVDPQSSDHLFLVRSLTRGRQVDLVEIEYSEGLNLLHSGAIDATVWSAEAIPATSGGLQVVPLDPEHEPALLTLGEAAIVVARGNLAVAHVIEELIDPAALAATQRDVVAGRRRPAY